MLANPVQVKNRKGHKTDAQDSWWLAHLLRHGMIRASFIPSSWGGICPGNNESAGKHLSRHTTHGNPWFRATLTECAWAASRTKGSDFQLKYERLQPKIGHKRALGGGGPPSGARDLCSALATGTVSAEQAERVERNSAPAHCSAPYPQASPTRLLASARKARSFKGMVCYTLHPESGSTQAQV